jgi:hypothetical protein
MKVQAESQRAPSPPESGYPGDLPPRAVTAPPAAARQRSRNLWLMAALALALLAACGIVVFGAFFLLSGAFAGFGDYSTLAETLVERLEADGAGDDIWVGWELFTPPAGETENWLTIEMQTTKSCGVGGADPCERLAYKAAGITLEEHPRIDEYAGIYVRVTSSDSAGSTFTVEKQMSLDDWRSELAAFED